MAESLGRADLDAAALLLTCTPQEQIAALNYLNDRVASDIHKGTAAAIAVCEFIWFAARAPEAVAA